MKLNLLALSALLGLAAAATETTTSDNAVVTLSPEAKCAERCDARDRCCIAACYRVPCPSDSQANETNRCVAACPQGDGSPADTKKFADCEQDCYSSHFFPGTAGGSSATETGSSGTVATGVSATETGSSKGSATGFKSSSDGASNTGSSASSSSTGAVQTGAAANVKLGSSGAGLVGLALAAFAL